MAKEKRHVSGPLLSWDIYMEGYYKLMRRGGDLQQLKDLSKKQAWKSSTWNLEEQFLRQNKIVLVTDPSIVIQFATSNIKEMNGYEPEEVVGRSPKMFQGPQTEKEKRLAIRDALQRRVPFETVIVNYRKDGSLYHCHVEEYPIWNMQGKLVNFIAFEKIA